MTMRTFPFLACLLQAWAVSSSPALPLQAKSPSDFAAESPTGGDGVRTVGRETGRQGDEATELGNESSLPSIPPLQLEVTAPLALDWCTKGTVIGREKFEALFRRDALFKNCKLIVSVATSADRPGWGTSHHVEMSAVHAAAYFDVTRVLEPLLEAGADPDSRECIDKSKRYTGSTPLIMSAKSSDHDGEATKVLLSDKYIKAITLGAKNQDGDTAIDIAAKEFNIPALALLMDTNGVHFGVSENTAPAYLRAAASTGNTEVLRWARSCLAEDSSVFRSGTSSDPRPPLMVAAELGHEEAVKWMVSHCPFDATQKVKFSDGKHREEESALSIAASAGHQKVVDIILKQAPKLSLDLAPEAAWPDIIDFVRKSTVREKLTPLRGAIIGSCKFTKQLLALGASPEEDLIANREQVRVLAVRSGALCGSLGLLAWGKGKGKGKDFSTTKPRPKSWCEGPSRPNGCAPSAAAGGETEGEEKKDEKEKEEEEGMAEDLCMRPPLLLASTPETAHFLVNWAREDDGVDKEAFEAEGTKAVEKALKEGKMELASAFLASGIGNKMVPTFEVHDYRDVEFMAQVKAWNRYHWGAYTCDLFALSDFRQASEGELKKRPTTGKGPIDKSPLQIGLENGETCAEYQEAAEAKAKAFADVQSEAIAKKVSKYETPAKVVTVIACAGELAITLLFLKRKSLYKAGRFASSVAPLVFSLGGLLIVTLKGLGIGVATAVFGVLLFLAVWVSIGSTHAKQKLEQLDGYWAVPACVLSWVPVLPLAVEVGACSGRGLWSLLAGVLHAVASSMPTSEASLPLRPLPGVVAIAALAYDFSHPGAEQLSPLVPTSGMAMVLATTSLSLAAACLPGVYQSKLQAENGQTLELATREGTRTTAGSDEA